LVVNLRTGWNNWPRAAAKRFEGGFAPRGPD
jgi:hypothetical protein